MTNPSTSERTSTRPAPPVTLDDLTTEHVGPEYLSWLNDPVVMAFTEARFRQHTYDNTRAYVEETNASNTDRIWRILFTGRHVGNIKLAGINTRHRRASLSIIVGDRSVWGCGIASEAIRLATVTSFARYDLFKIFAGIYSENVASIRAFEKAGYIHEATLRGHRFHDGRMVDEFLMARFNSPVT